MRINFKKYVYVCRPIGRKAYHKNYPAEMMRETVKLEAEEVKSKSVRSENSTFGSNLLWVPHEKTGIYYPKGHEKVMEDIPPNAGKDAITINWFSYDDNI
ncbi:hypothetical protein L484_001357 [Morus notabilis]|uniref:Uncharacterized protein n=1 Tax=Morus notabilis TaxID=981085 RepID=W9SDQ2_9ROSA|nr:hypothetical protein L484_001357 [Morus notabilis]